MEITISTEAAATLAAWAHDMGTAPEQLAAQALEDLVTRGYSHYGQPAGCSAVVDHGGVGWVRQPNGSTWTPVGVQVDIPTRRAGVGWDDMAKHRGPLTPTSETHAWGLAQD